jgi:TRAP-type C4-dicarboxylate transport system permease small subunit
MSAAARPGARALRAWRALLDVSGLFSGALVALICIGVCADVLLRWTGLGNIPWMLETVEYVQYVMVLAGAAWVLAKGAHVAMDYVVAVASGRTRLLTERAAAAIGTASCGVFTAASIAATIDVYRAGAIAYKSVEIPEWWPLAVLSVAFLALTVEFALQLAGAAHEREKLEL